LLSSRDAEGTEASASRIWIASRSLDVVSRQRYQDMILSVLPASVLLLPEIPEPSGGELGVAGGALEVAVAEPRLQRPGVVAVVGELAAGWQAILRPRPGGLWA
jgi:hypothetical protein